MQSSGNLNFNTIKKILNKFLENRIRKSINNLHDNAINDVARLLKINNDTLNKVLYGNNNNDEFKRRVEHKIGNKLAKIYMGVSFYDKKK